jgi:FKBP-type peptidyl-prolyl cis-trans isomerase
MFLDGSVFDQSREPIEFPLNGVIPGWTEVLQLMREGDQFQVFIPAKLGYGERGALNRQTGQYDIPPHATLIFEIALVQVVPLEDIPIK